MRKINCFAVIFILLSVISEAWGQVITVFSDDFSTNQSGDWITSGQIGSSYFYVNRSGADWGARRNTNGILELTNDASGTGNADGWVFAYVNTTSFGSPYNPVLSSNSGPVTWYFNMRQIRTDPAGFSAINHYGVAFILSADSSEPRSKGKGYAVVLGRSGEVDSIRLAKFQNGLSGTLTNIITSNTSGLTDFGTEYVSIKVIYNPSNNKWELYLRKDGTSGFADPQSGTLISQGTATDNTYTSSSLNYMGAYWQGSTSANQTAFFDNITVKVTKPPVISVTHAFSTGSVNQAFAGTGVTISCDVTTGANVTVNKYNSSPANVSFSGATPAHISNYRWVINAPGLAFNNGTIKFAVAELSGIGDPNTVDIYKRSTPGSGAFTKLTTTYSGDYLTASIDGFSEFILGSDDNDNSLPVTLTAFNAQPVSNGVLLTWSTESETENLGFIIAKKLKAADAQWTEIASYTTDEALAGHGSTSEKHTYQYLDQAIQPGATYIYRLADVAYNGKVTWHKEVEVKVEGAAAQIPTTFGLQAVYPNPFNPKLTLRYGLVADGPVSLKIYNLRGELVATLVDQQAAKGVYTVTWQPQELSAGVYLVRLQSGSQVQQRKVLFLK